MKNRKRNVKSYLPICAIPLFLIALASYIALLLARRNSAVAEWLTSGIGYWLRRLLAALTQSIPFSFAELLVLLAPLVIIIIIAVAARKKGARSRVRFLAGLLSLLSLFYSSYVFTLGVGYHRTSLSSRLDIEKVEITEERLYSTLLILKNECEGYLDSVKFSESGSSESPISFDVISEKINEAYASLDREMPSLNLKSFHSSAKEVGISSVLTGFEISGIYSFFTGEANVNTHYPDYMTPFTLAHELAHQRGIARENEANFVAFLVCIRADSDYIRYSAYMNMFEYVASALSRTNKDKLREVYSELDPLMYGEMRAFNKFYYDHKNELMSEISDFMNDNYLKANGTEGIISYGLVVELCVAYYANDG